MSTYFREYYNDDHTEKDHSHLDSNIQYTINRSQVPTLEFKGSELSGTVVYSSDESIFTINGSFNGVSNTSLKYWAASPILRNYSSAGSGLPFPNPELAYENTPNQGQVLLDNNGHFMIKVNHPGAYYAKQGTILLKPHIHFKVNGIDQVYTIDIADYLPYRSLSNFPDRPYRSIAR